MDEDFTIIWAFHDTFYIFMNHSMEFERNWREPDDS